jgi:hypothetical protein
MLEWQGKNWQDVSGRQIPFLRVPQTSLHQKRSLVVYELIKFYF